jgi:hypothetical protein
MEEARKVRVDWFICDVTNIEVDLSPALMGGLISSAMQYLKANGTITWEKWSLLSDASRMAFSEAFNTLKSRDAADIPT